MPPHTYADPDSYKETDMTRRRVPAADLAQPAPTFEGHDITSMDPGAQADG